MAHSQTETIATCHEMELDVRVISDAFRIPTKARLCEEWSVSTRYYIAGWLTWLTLAITISYSVLMLEERSVTGSYRAAVFNWIEGKPLYNLRGHGFLYLPQAALTFAPWAVMPHETGEIAWRLFNMAVMAAAVVRLTKLLNGDGRWFFAISASSALMDWGCARNGQSTLLITGMMVFAISDLSDRNWWRAAAMLALAFAVKPLVFVLILLVAVVYPQVSWRLAISLLVAAIIPFATQQTEYVVEQYLACVESLKVTFQVGENENWAQLFGLLTVVGVPTPEPARNLIRIVAAIATLALCLGAARKLSSQRAVYYIFSLSACYVMLFNSRTEGNTYAMVGPVYGALLAEAAFVLKKQLWAWRMVAAVVLSVANYDLALLVSSRDNAVWISPLVCLVVSIYLIKRLSLEIRNLPSPLSCQPRSLS